MKVFSDYARYYDLLYRDKEYSHEVAYINQLIQQMKPGAKKLLSVGCGTGRHDILLSNYGYAIKGIDLSETMIDLANRNKQAGKLEFEVGDACTYRDESVYDGIISLFHVVNYQCSNQALSDFFTTAAAHLNSGGIFIFDSWYGPAVLSDKPFKKIREIEDEEIKIIRRTEPSIDYNSNVAQINFNVQVLSKKSNMTTELNERHSMRYLFHPEVQFMAMQSGFQIVKFKKWMTDEEPSEKSWYVVYGMVKV